MTLSTVTLSIVTLSIVTLSIVTLSIVTLSIVTLNIIMVSLSIINEMPSAMIFCNTSKWFDLIFGSMYFGQKISWPSDIWLAP